MAEFKRKNPQKNIVLAVMQTSKTDMTCLWTLYFEGFGSNQPHNVSAGGKQGAKSTEHRISLCCCILTTQIPEASENINYLKVSGKVQFHTSFYTPACRVHFHCSARTHFMETSSDTAARKTLFSIQVYLQDIEGAYNLPLPASKQTEVLLQDWVVK